MAKNTTWKTGDGRSIELNEMEDSHLQSAFLTLCVREFKSDRQLAELWGKLALFHRLKKAMKTEAKRRGIKLKYPDQHPGYTQHNGLDWKHFFEAERKTESASTEKRPVLIAPTRQIEDDD